MNDSSHKLDKKQKYKNLDLIARLHDCDVDLLSNHIYLFGHEGYIGAMEGEDEPGVEFGMANRFIRNMNLCMRHNSEDPILIHMKSNGGHWTEGMAIHNMIAACPTPVTILSYTHARSMSSLILQAANKRVMMPDSYFLFHEGSMGVEGTPREVFSSVDYEKNVCIPRMYEIYANAMLRGGKFSNWSKKKIIDMLKERVGSKVDVFLTAEEAVEWGLADEVFGKDGKYDWSQLIEYTEEELSRG